MMNHPPRVLVIDRAEELEYLDAVDLPSLGVDVATANDGEAGLRAAHNYCPDIILLAVELPGIGGFELCERLKADPHTSTVPILFVTGTNDPDSKLRGFDLGAADYVTKPYHPAELRARVKRVLDTLSNLHVLAIQSHTDSLCGLPNRAGLIYRLEQALERTRRNPDHRFALLYLDFDRFKIINDSLGHSMGDQLLVAMASRIHTSLSTGIAHELGGSHHPARLGGDEFVVLLDNLANETDAVEYATQLRRRLAEPHMLGTHQVTVTASIGIVFSSRGHETVDEMIRDADTAMYHAKTRGGDAFAVFDGAMRQAVVDRMELEKELRIAVDRLEFALEYQPIHSLQTGGLIGFEALMRWHHPRRGLITRPEYIPLAEELGLIVQLGRWALFEAARTLKKWHDRFPADPPLTINVNVSKRQLTHSDFPQTVREVLEETRLDPTTLKLEVTESVIMDHFDEVAPILQQLRALRVHLCLDDFGTGHSSLACLHQFPIDVLKIDRAFLKNMDMSREYAAVTHAIVTLAHNLGMIVVAEGVETSGQVAQLQALECDYAQGFFFSRAIVREEAEALILRNPHLHRDAG